MGQQQSIEKYNRKISNSNISQNDSYNSNKHLDNVNDNIKGKGKIFMIPTKAKDKDRISRINDILYTSKSKNSENGSSSIKNQQFDFITDNSRSRNHGNFSDNILNNSIRNDVGTNYGSDSRNINIPRVYIPNDNNHLSSPLDNATSTYSSTNENNNQGSSSYPVTFIQSTSATSNDEFRRNSRINYEDENNNNNSNNNNNNHGGSSSSSSNENITYNWHSSREQGINNNDNNAHPNINHRQVSRIQIIQDTQSSEMDINNTTTNNDTNELNRQINEPITIRTRNRNGEHGTTIIYQNTNSSSSTSRAIPSSLSTSSSSSSSSNSNSNSNGSIDNINDSPTSTTADRNENSKKKDKNINLSIKNKYKETTSVSLSYQNLTILPNYLFELKNLVFLDITHNSLRELPLKLFKLKNLKKLACSDNLIEQVPSNIECLKKLTWLDFTHNRLQSIPESIGNLTELVGLGLSDCRLTRLPYSIKNLKNLTKLGVFNNNISWIPPEIGCLESLIKLDLSSNKLQKIPTEIKFLKNLQWLNLSDNKLNELPTEMNELRNLKELGLGHNSLRYIPDLSKLKKLIMLPIYSNKLEYIGNWICNMKSLEKLDLSDNRLTFIPPGIFKLPKLNYLNIKNNQLKHVACDFSLYSSFSQIDLSTSFELIKDEIIDKNIIVYPYLNNLPFSKLDFLDLSNNQLTYIPSILSKLTLSTMKFKNNNFQSLFKQCSTDFNIKFNQSLSSNIPIIYCKEIPPTDVTFNNINNENMNEHIPHLSFFDEILLAEQYKNNNKNKISTPPLPTRSMDIILPSKEHIPKTFLKNEYIQIIPSKSFPSLASLCINHIFKKYSKKCNPRFCKYHNNYINSTYSFVKLCDTVSNTNLCQSIFSSEESMFYSKIGTPKDLKYLGSINDLNITLGSNYFEFFTQSDLSYLSSKLQNVNSNDDINEKSFLSQKYRSHPSNSNHNVSNGNDQNYSASSSNYNATLQNDHSSSHSSINNNDSNSHRESSSSLDSKSKKGKGLSKFRHFIGKSTTKNEKDKEKIKNKGKKISGSNSSISSDSNHSKDKRKDDRILLEERPNYESSIPPIYNNKMIKRPSKALSGYKDIDIDHPQNYSEMNLMGPSSIPNSNKNDSFYSNSSMNNLVKPTTNCLHALYNIIKTLPEYTQYAFKYSLICDVCGNNYVTTDSLEYFRSKSHQSIRSLVKKTIDPSPYHQNLNENLNKIEEDDIQNIIKDYGSIRILLWKYQDDQTNFDGEDIAHRSSSSNSLLDRNNQFTITIDSQIDENNEHQNSLSSSSIINSIYNDLDSKTFDNLIPYNYRICSHSCMKKLINYLNLHYG